MRQKYHFGPEIRIHHKLGRSSRTASLCIYVTLPRCVAVCLAGVLPRTDVRRRDLPLLINHAHGRDGLLRRLAVRRVEERGHVTFCFERLCSGEEQSLGPWFVLVCLSLTAKRLSG